jgi:hypothetical protein
MTPRNLLRLALALGICLALSATVPGSGAADAQIAQPNASFPQDFGSIQTVRELPDGRVLVADPLGKALYVVDMASGQRQTIGREGEGPEEYRQPDAVWPLPGDSTLLVDLGNGRLVAMGPDLGFGPTMPIQVGDFQPGSGNPLVLALPQGVDSQGNIYARETGMGTGGSYPDSARVLRINRTDKTHQPVATVKIRSVTQSTSGGANDRMVRIAPIPLSPEDPWGVAPDGSVVIARSGDFHLERIALDGTVTKGQPVSFTPESIGTPEKEEHLLEDGRAGGGVGVTVQMDGSSIRMGFARGGTGGRNRELDQYDWPEKKPPFYSGRIPIDPLGRAWVRRHVDAGDPSTYDIFDEAGSRVGNFRLENGNQVVGFGKGSVYVVAYDELDLSYLQRYAMPVF